jgi:tRNA 2-selenouridine synthase
LRRLKKYARIFAFDNMIRNTTITDFLQLKKGMALIDVRTPAEFEQGHVPGAFNIPLFSNEERVKVGITYKQIGREEAILLGFDLTGSKWSGFIKDALAIAPDKRVAVHCWRGGMRSGAMAWALNLYGFEVYLVEGGYKRYRRWVRQRFEDNLHLVVLGGLTGSGKTRLLHQLRIDEEQVIDLEDIAQHQGSVYGSMNKMVQPTQEQFENNLAANISGMDPERRIWVEDESLTVGRRSIPNGLWQQMRSAVMVDVQVAAAQRIAALTEEYGNLDKAFLIECTERIRKRLGPEQAKNAIIAINENRMADFIKLALVYYDKTYRTGLSTRDQAKIYPIALTSDNIAINAHLVLKLIITITENYVV